MPLRPFEITTTARRGKFINYFSAASAGGLENMNNGLIGQFIRKMPEGDRRKYVYAISEIKFTVRDQASLRFFLDPRMSTFTNTFDVKEFFFEEDFTDDGYIKTNLLQTALRVTIENLPGFSSETRTQLYDHGEGTCTVKIIGFPFETHIKEYANNVTVVYVNGAFNTAQDLYPHPNYGTAGIGLKVLDEFMANVGTLPQKQLVYIFNAGPIGTEVPRDNLVSYLRPINAAASISTIGMNAYPETSLPNRPAKFFRLANSAPNDNFHTFDPTIDGKVSGRNALIASRINTNFGDPFLNIRQDSTRGPGSPGGIHMIRLYSTSVSSTLSHEFAHFIGDLEKHGNKFLSNILHAYPAVDQQSDSDNAYKNWCQIQFPGSDLTPKFDRAHPRPQYGRIKFPLVHAPLSICPVLVMENASASSGFLPIDVTQLVSYGSHPLMMTGTVLEIAQNLGASSSEDSNLGSSLFEFYVFAGAIYMTTLNKIKKIYDARNAFFISNKSAYPNLLSVVKQTETYAFIELVNYGVDNLSSDFSGAEKSEEITKKLNDFRGLRPEYDLSYSDSIIGDADILKRNNYQNHSSSHSEVHDGRRGSTGAEFLSHVSDKALSAMGFEALGESDEIIEVYNGQPVVVRNEDVLLDVPKNHHLVISRAKELTVEALEEAHRNNSNFDKTLEQQVIGQIYQGALIPHKLSFSNLGSDDVDFVGEVEKFVYIIVKQKTNIKGLSSKKITDSIERVMDII